MLQDPDAGGDVLFWLYATVAYAVLRVTTEVLFPGKIGKFTTQQFVISLLHQGIVLPVCIAMWVAGTPAAPEIIYLLTGAYLASDSIMNYTPVSGCVVGTINATPVRQQRRTADFSWGIHAHHLFTVLLCALGTNLPPSLVREGAVCILLGEAGSLWISVSLLRPSRLNSLIRYYAFLVTRLIGFALGLNLVLKVESPTMASALWCLVAGLLVDNARTLRAFRRAALGMQREDSFVTGPYMERPGSPRSTTTALHGGKHD
jgi:hypothetical protein